MQCFKFSVGLSRQIKIQVTLSQLGLVSPFSPSAHLDEEKRLAGHVGFTPRNITQLLPQHPGETHRAEKFPDTRTPGSHMIQHRVIGSMGDLDSQMQRIVCAT